MIVISDMMGTLTTGSPVLGFIDWVRHNQSETQARWLMAKITPGYFLAKSGLIDAQRWKLKLMIESLSWIHARIPKSSPALQIGPSNTICGLNAGRMSLHS